MGEFAYIKHSDRVGIIALKFHRWRSHFLSDVFAAVAVVVQYLKLPNISRKQEKCKVIIMMGWGGGNHCKEGKGAKGHGGKVK